MTFYPGIVLVLGGGAAYVGIESLTLYAVSRKRLYAWIGLLGMVTGTYCVVSFQMYSSTNAAEGARWQFWQLVISAIMVDVAILLGLEYVGALRRIHVLGLAVLTCITVGPMWIDGLGLTEHPAIKEIPWLGVCYHEVELGPAPMVFFIVGVLWMGYVAILLVRRALRGTLRDRLMCGVYVLWWVAGTNDTMVSSGVYQGPYVVEFAFFLIIVVVASMAMTAQHREGQLSERARQLLAVEVVAKDRDLAFAQAELTEAAKLAAVGRLAAGVAHEVNNPLAYVMANLQLLEQGLGDKTDLLTLTRESLDGARRIQVVVRQLFGFSATAPATVGWCDPAAAADAAVKMSMVELRDRALLEVKLPALPHVQMDEGQLAQVLLNLLVNAAQSIPPGKRDENRVVIEARTIDGQVEISVTDTGTGMPENVLPHIFEPFFSTKKILEGQGLGLAISREIVRKAGGQIVAENVAPHGARLLVRLPVALASASCSPQPTGTAPRSDEAVEIVARERLRLLLVDDEEPLRRALSRLLERSYDVQTADSGQAALACLENGRDFDVILCDMMMPNVSGVEVIHRIREENPALLHRMILMTGGMSNQQQRHVDGDQSFPVLAKPFNLAEFNAALGCLRMKRDE